MEQSITRVLPLPFPSQQVVEHDFAPEPIFVAFADHSVAELANPLGVVAAFRTAFPQRRDVRLRFYITNSAANPEAAERLRLATINDSRIQLCDDEMTAFAGAICLVSLPHRGVGDLVAAQVVKAIARSMCVVSPQYGAVAELFELGSGVLAERAGFFVPHDVAGSPDLDAAARALRAIADDRQAALAAGRFGNEHVARTRSLTQVGGILREHVEAAYRLWRSRQAAKNILIETDPLAALRAAKHAVHRQPDIGVTSRIPMAPQLRKMILRLIDHYDSHVKDVLGTFIDGIERTSVELARRQDELSKIIASATLDDIAHNRYEQAERQSELQSRVSHVEQLLDATRPLFERQELELREIEEVFVAELDKGHRHNDLLAARVDKFAIVLEKTLDRVDAMESRIVEMLRERDKKLELVMQAIARMQPGTQNATHQR